METVTLSTDQLRDMLREAARQGAAEALRPALVPAAYIATRYSISELTVHRTCDRLGIPKRDMHGAPKTQDGGVTLYSLHEWESAGRMHTRKIRNQLRREGSL